MLQYFRINDPYRLLALLVMLIILWLPVILDNPGITYPEIKSIVLGEKVADGFSLYTDIIDNTPPLAAWFYGLTDWIFGRSLTGRHIAAFILLFSQSVYLGVMLISKKAFPENTYVPSLIFSLLTLISFDMVHLSAGLVAFGFLLLSMNALLTELEFRASHDDTMLSIGLFTGIASLLVFSYSLFIPGFVLMLVFFTRNTIRQYLLLLLGFLLPHLLLISSYNLIDGAGALWQNFYLPSMSFPTLRYFSFTSMMYLCAVPLVYLVVAVIMLNRKAHLTKYQSQVMQVMWLWFLVALVQLFFSPSIQPQSLLPLLPPAAFFFTHFQLLIRRRKFANMNAWIMLLGIPGLMYLWRYEHTEKVDYHNLMVNISSAKMNGQRVLNLTDEYAVFVNHKAASGFINWTLSKPVFDQPQYYENVLMVNRQIKKDPPDIIIDPEKYMTAFFERIPELRQQYQQLDNGMWQRISN